MRFALLMLSNGHRLKKKLLIIVKVPELMRFALLMLSNGHRLKKKTSFLETYNHGNYTKVQHLKLPLANSYHYQE